MKDIQFFRSFGPDFSLRIGDGVERIQYDARNQKVVVTMTVQLPEKILTGKMNVNLKLTPAYVLGE